ncbi:MAG: Hpt domain-containing protein, partial [Gammaproteobacteria bacterium]
VEDELDRELVRAVVQHNDGDVAEDSGEVQYSQVTQAVMNECIVNLAKVKEAVVRLVDAPEDTRPLESVRPQLRGIAAGLLMLNKTTVVRLIERIGAVLLDGLTGSDGRLDTQRVERLADSIVSVEYYMETVSAGRKDPWYMLENAARCLELLESTSTGIAPAPLELEAPSDTMPQPAVTDAVEARTPPSPEPEPAEPAAGSTRVIAAIESEDETTDPELIEIFIEEARGEIAAVEQHLSEWLADPDDFDAISATRRSFHTLKGSGRTVGANLMGDFAWSIENMLNRVINRTLALDASVSEVVRDAATALPMLLEHLELGIAPQADIEEIRRRADALASGESVDAAAGAPAAAPRIDPVLAEIFVKETRGHLATVRDWLARNAAHRAPYEVDESLYRAVHTLLGSANMANYAPCVRIAEPLSSLLSHCFQSRIGLDEHGLNLLAEASAAIGAVADGLAENRVIEPPEDLLRKLARHIDTVSRVPPVPEPPEVVPEATESVAAGPVQAPGPASAPAMAPDLEPEPEPEAEPEPEPEPVTGAGDFDPEIAAIFTEEAAELLERGEVVLQELRGGADSAAGFGELQRLLHTFKGGARLAGITQMGDLSHALETLLERMADGRIANDAAAMALVQSAFDELQQMRECVDLGQPFADSGALLAQLRATALGEQPARSTPPDRGVDEAAELRAEILGETANQPLDFDLTEVGLEGVTMPAPGAPEPSIDSTRIDRAGIESSGTIEMGAEQLSELRAAADHFDVETARRAAGVQAHPSAPGRPTVTPPSALAEQTQPFEDAAPPADSAAPTEQQTPPAAEAQRGSERSDVARVDAQLLDSLLNAAGEISIFQARLNQQVRSVDFHLGELGQTVTRLREQLRKLEAETEAEILHRHQDDAPGADDFDPLELDRYSTIQQLSRALSETANDVASINELLLGLTNEADTLLTQQGRVTADIQDGLMQTRMVPFQRHVTRFARLVRQTAAETGKSAELEVHGAAAELDRHVLESMLPPLEHLLRNSVVHGIEPPETRAAAGKPPVGRILLRINREGGEVSIDVEDDGGGLDIAAITRIAVERGLLAEGQAITEKQAAEMILMPGFSTAGKLTQSAGRGVGMDVVDNELKKLGGSMTIESSQGRGTKFHIRLPYTLAITHALIVDVGDETFALPLTTVEGITRVRREHLLELLTQDDPRLDYGELSYRLQHLGALVGSGASALPQEDGAVALVLVRAGENSTALLTDRLEGSREVVVKGMGPHIASVPGVTGATILGDGRVIMILDAGTLIRLRPQQPISAEPVAPQARDSSTLTALVVDDSITMRRVTERLLERRGVKVVTARDGLDAITALQDCDPDIILLDIEMPRMDGYQFAAHVRNDARFSQLPIIMITSRSGEKHRAKAIELGVNDYLSKPYQEQHLIDAIESQLGRSL